MGLRDHDRGNIMLVTGDPAMLNDVGAALQATAEEADRASGTGGMSATSDVLIEDQALLEESRAHTIAQHALGALAGALHADGYHLQRAARELEKVGGVTLPVRPSPIGGPVKISPVRPPHRTLPETPLVTPVVRLPPLQADQASGV